MSFATDLELVGQGSITGRSWQASVCSSWLYVIRIDLYHILTEERSPLEPPSPQAAGLKLMSRVGATENLLGHHRGEQARLRSNECFRIQAYSRVSYQHRAWGVRRFGTQATGYRAEKSESVIDRFGSSGRHRLLWLQDCIKRCTQALAVRIL